MRKGLNIKGQLQDELSVINRKLSKKLSSALRNSSATQDEDNANLKKELIQKIAALKQMLGVEKRVKNASSLPTGNSDGADGST